MRKNEDIYYEELIDNFVDFTQKIFGDKLTGIYLHGSMAMGCFNPKQSDIDLIIVIESDISDTQKMEFMNKVIELNEQAPKKGLELSVVKREFCKTFVYPTPYELHFSPVYLEWFERDSDDYIKNMNGTDKDLAAHFTIINHYGIVLYGEKIQEVFGAVPKIDYIDSILFDVENAKTDIVSTPVYIILNLCRVLAFLKEEKCLSKKQGGEWGLMNLHKEYSLLILQALEAYDSVGAMQADIDIAKQFADETLENIKMEIEKNRLKML